MGCPLRRRFGSKSSVYVLDVLPSCRAVGIDQMRYSSGLHCCLSFMLGVAEMSSGDMYANESRVEGVEGRPNP